MKKLFQVMIVVFLIVGLVGVVNAGPLIKIEEVMVFYQTDGRRPVEENFKKPMEETTRSYKAKKYTSVTIGFDLKVDGKLLSAGYHVSVKDVAGKLYLGYLTLDQESKEFKFLLSPNRKMPTSISFSFGNLKYAEVKIVGKKIKITFFKIGAPSKKKVPPQRPEERLRARLA